MRRGSHKVSSQGFSVLGSFLSQAIKHSQFLVCFVFDVSLSLTFLYAWRFSAPGISVLLRGVSLSLYFPELGVSVSQASLLGFPLSSAFLLFFARLMPVRPKSVVALVSSFTVKTTDQSSSICLLFYLSACCCMSRQSGKCISGIDMLWYRQAYILPLWGRGLIQCDVSNLIAYVSFVLPTPSNVHNTCKPMNCSS